MSHIWCWLYDQLLFRASLHIGWLWLHGPRAIRHRDLAAMSRLGLDHTALVSINNCVNEVCFGLLLRDEELRARIGVVDRKELALLGDLVRRLADDQCPQSTP